MGKSQSFAPSSISAIERTLEALEFKLADYPFGYHKYLDQLLLEGIPPLLLRVMIALIHQKMLLKLKKRAITVSNWIVVWYDRVRENKTGSLAAPYIRAPKKQVLDC
jgi:hypothetical protein